jgi:hypothetical protein
VTVVTNSEFLSALDGIKPLGTFLWVNSFIGDPNSVHHQEWKGLPYRTGLREMVDKWGNRNTYFSTAALKTTTGRTKDNFSRLLVIVADDVSPDQLNGQPSYLLETSPGKYQAGVFIDPEDPDAVNPKLVGAVIDTLANAGHMSVDRSGNNIVRYVRLPLGQNQKKRDSGPFNHIIHSWHPDHVLSLADAAMVFGIDIDALSTSSSSSEPQGEFGKQSDKLSTSIKNIIEGEALHESVNVLTSSLIASGTHPGAVVNITRALMDESAAPRDERFKSRYEDIPRAVSTAEKFKPQAFDLPTNEPHGTDRFKFLSAGDLKRQQRVGWRVLDVIPKKGLVVMWGQPGSGKSFAAFDIGAAIARGIKYQGKRVKQGLVLIIAAEGDLTARTMAYMKEHNLTDEDLENLMILQRGVNMLDKDQDMNDLMAAIQAAKEQANEELALVIIDTLNRVMPGGNENASEHMGAVISNAKLIEDAHHCAVMFVHHSGKDEGKGTRGHSSLKGAMDSEISILRNEDIRTFKIEKQKEGKDYYELFNFKLKTVDLGAMSDFDPEAEYGERLTSCVLEVTDEVAEKKMVTKNQDIFEQALELAESGNREVIRLKYYELHRGNADAKRRGFNRSWNAYSRSHLVEGYVRKYPKEDE